MEWAGCNILVTGGCSFIGSHLVDALVREKARVWVADNLSSGMLENIREHVDNGRVKFLRGDLLDPAFVGEAVEGAEIVFHLAADHGGRGYVDTHQTACATNLRLDSLVFHTCLEARVRKVVYASSGCVYPNFLQTDPEAKTYLTEDQVGPPYDADNMYGWAKLMGEMTLQACFRERGLKSVSLRYFTVFGPRGHENHAVMAMIARAFIRQDPFVVWGDGRQVRNWTHVSDIISGTLLAAEKIDDGRALNLGTTERVRVLDAVRQVLDYTGHRAKLEFRPEMPTGPLNRVADNSLAKALLSWQPRVSFAEGLTQTIDWYFSTHNREKVEACLDRRLTER